MLAWAAVPWPCCKCDRQRWAISTCTSIASLSSPACCNVQIGNAPGRGRTDAHWPMSEPRSPHYCDAIIWQHCSTSSSGRDSALLCHPQVHKQCNRVVYYTNNCTLSMASSSSLPKRSMLTTILVNDPRAHADCAAHDTISSACERERSAGCLGG